MMSTIILQHFYMIQQFYSEMGQKGILKIVKVYLFTCWWLRMKAANIINYEITVFKVLVGRQGCQTCECL